MTHPEVVVAEEGRAGSILDRNLAALKINNAALADDILAINPEGDDPAFPGLRFIVRDARNGQPTMLAVYGDSEIGIHSTYDPGRDAEQQVSGVLEKEERNYFVVLGFGLGYVVENLATVIGSNARLLVIEPHMAAFRKTLETRDVSGLLSDSRIVVTLGPNIDNSLAAFLGRYNLADVNGVGFIELAGRSKLPSSDFYAKFLERLKGVIVTTGGNLQTLMLMAWQYQKNTMTSLGHIIDQPPVRTLFGALENKPAIIVSAGPSLDKNIHQLKELKDQVVIIAVDTSLKPLLNAGIEPHLICTGDPQEANWKHLRGAETTSAHLVAEPMTYPASIEFFKDRLFIASYGDKVMTWLEKFIPEVGHTQCWGSVATMAFDLARKMGCDPIIFIGQDLSFPGGRTYVEGTYFEDEIKLDMSVDAYEKKHSTYSLTDIYGEPVKTNRQMFAYKEWFRTEFGRTQSRVINATEGGILKENCEIMPLREAALQLSGERFDAIAEIRNAGSNFEAYDLEPLKKGLFDNIASIQTCIECCEKGIARIREAVNSIEHMDTLSKSWALKVVKDLDDLRFIMMAEPSMKSFLETANQIGVLNFHRSYKATHGKEFSRVTFRESLDLFTDLFMSTGRTARGVLPFFLMGFNTLKGRSGES
jgi:hypothetical protein